MANGWADGWTRAMQYLGLSDPPGEDEGDVEQRLADLEERVRVLEAGRDGPNGPRRL